MYRYQQRSIHILMYFFSQIVVHKVLIPRTLQLQLQQKAITQCRTVRQTKHSYISFLRKWIIDSQIILCLHLLMRLNKILNNSQYSQLINNNYQSALYLLSNSTISLSITQCLALPFTPRFRKNTKKNLRISCSSSHQNAKRTIN